MKKVRLPKKVLTKQEARDKYNNLMTQIQTLEEEIAYFKQKIGEPLSRIDLFIIMSDKTVNSIEQIIERNTEQIRNKMHIINNYLLQYLH